MKKNGWLIDVKYSSAADWDPANARICGNETFYGYKPGDQVGTVSYTFREYGEATLGFGNCKHCIDAGIPYVCGYVVVMLNDGELARTGSNIDKSVTFQYKNGDSLNVSEIHKAIIKLNYLKLECGSKSQPESHQF